MTQPIHEPSQDLEFRARVERFAEAFWDATHPEPTEQWDFIRQRAADGYGDAETYINHYTKGAHAALVMEMERGEWEEGEDGIRRRKTGNE